ncbi:hypothetical protein MED121_00060 [Marinomonas sp. MED121]|uniref:TatD family hydrolase n=1 Tax=Marinomonas sp. MED121 TaxID=314277 RepID=UPI0000690161|nr:TatD family hydrolase [Marinomonas sp. MED121]EAQ63292.1 hypothetical protein MED121_00060 [Marinomonas sp. MED121]
MLIDTHCHLDKLDLTPYNNDLQLLLDAAAEVGVKQIMSICVDLSEVEKVMSYTQRAGVYASVGVHPLHKDGLMLELDDLLPLLEDGKVAAVGETGLDFFYEKSTELHQQQIQSFIVHLEAAKRTQLPLVIHTREAREETMKLIRAHGNIDVGGILHCFTESYEMAAAALDENYLISISGIATFKTANELRDVIKKIPLTSLLVETDAPYLAPVPHRGKKNEPKFVAEVAQLVADVKGVRFEAVLEQTAENFHQKFTRIDARNQLSLRF